MSRTKLGLVIFIAIVLIVPVLVYAEDQSTPQYIPPGANVSAPPSCPDAEIQTAANNFLTNKVGQDYFNTHFSVKQIGGGEMRATILYDISYTLPSGTYIIGTSVEFSDDCQTVTDASGILHPYNVVVDKAAAIKTVTDAGYVIDPASVKFTATTDPTPPDDPKPLNYRKPVWLMRAPDQNPACKDGGYESYTIYADNGNLAVSTGCIIPESAEGKLSYWWIVIVIGLVAIALIFYFVKKRR